MKVTYLIEKESKTARRKKMYCPKCESRYYCVCHQLRPEELECWWVECESCGWESAGAPTREIALARWKQRGEC